MRMRMTRVWVAVAAAAALSAMGITEAPATGATAWARQQPRAPSAASAAVACPGAQLWVKRYNGPANGEDYPHSMAVSPNGNTVYVTGQSLGLDGAGDYATVAYNAATGTRLWVARYSGPANDSVTPAAVAASPTGSMVFVTGYGWSEASSTDYITVAYNAATGAQVWVKRYNGPANEADAAHSVAVSPSGGTVFVTGESTVIRDEDTDIDYTTIAYSAATGARLWLKRYDSPSTGPDSAWSVAISPTGDRVFVTGYSGTVAYNAATGAQLWVKYDGATSAAVSPGGDKVFVIGDRYWEPATGDDYVTVAYNAATGTRLWVARYAGPSTTDRPTSMAVSPGGGTVFVTGYSMNPAAWDYNYATVAYNAATGAQLWVKRSSGPGEEHDAIAAVSPTGNTVYITGSNPTAAPGAFVYVTFAYNAATGTRQWVNRYNGQGNGNTAEAIAVSPSSGTVFVTGGSTGTSSGWDYATIAYRG